MAKVPEKVLVDALKLPAGQRAALASSLIASLEGDEVDDDAEAAWAKEIARRVKELDHGKVKLIPWPEVRRGILARIHGRGHA